MTVNRDPKTRLGSNVGLRGQEVDATTTSSEIIAAQEATKNSILTSLITVTNAAPSTLMIITYTGTGRLFIANNALLLFSQQGTAATTTGSSGTITVTAGGIGSGTFTDIALQNSFYNWDVGKSPTVNFTAQQGVDGDTITAPTQTLNFRFSSAMAGAVQTDTFVMESGAIYALGVTLPGGITSADVQLSANVYEEAIT